MMSDKGKVLSIAAALDKLTHYPVRTPKSSGTQFQQAFSMLSEYRDGAIFLADYAGNSEWERHTKGDEIVMVLEGETLLFLLKEGKEFPHRLTAGELIVVPANTWHRFETPNGVKLMAVTPTPTDHQVEKPES